MCTHSTAQRAPQRGRTRWSGEKRGLSPDCRVRPRCGRRARVLTVHVALGGPCITFLYDIKSR